MSSTPGKRPAERSCSLDTVDNSTKKIKRAQVKVACDGCRKKRSKCDGFRPSCHTCRKRGLDCQYSADADATPMEALRRRHYALCQARADDMVTIDHLRSALNAKDLGIPQSQVTGGNAQGSPVEGIHNPRHDIDGEPSDVDAFQHTKSLPCEQTSSELVTVLLSPSSQQDGQDRKDDAMLLLQSMASKSDSESIALLARLRMGHNWRTLVDDVLHNQIFLGADTGSELSSPDGASQKPSRPWLTTVFDRQYFLTAGHIPCNWSPSTIPDTYESLNFGNLPFSSSIGANHYPLGTQQMQHQNLVSPAWAMRPITGASAADDPFEAILVSLAADLSAGMNIDHLCGPHAFVAALDDEHTFHRAPKLSQVVARIVQSIKVDEGTSTFTQYAMMHWYWALVKWMLLPTKEAYRDIPAHARPAPSQLFVAHPRVFDFLVSPKLRDLMCQEQTADVRWITEGATTIHCDWNGALAGTLCKDGMTRELDLNPICKAHLALGENWSFGASVRPFLTNADFYIRISTD